MPMYYMGKLKMTEEAFSAYCEQAHRRNPSANSRANRVAISDACQRARHRAGEP